MTPSHSRNGGNRRTLGPRSLVVVVISGALITALMRAVYSTYQTHDNVHLILFMSCWFILILGQIFVSIWAWLSRSDRGLSKRQQRRRRAFAMTFEVGALPVIIFLLVSVYIWQDPKFETDWWQSPIWVNAFRVTGFVAGALNTLSIPLKLLTLAVYCGWRDRFLVVLSRLAILFNTCVPYFIVW